jgi:hypothetical protein
MKINLKDIIEKRFDGEYYFKGNLRESFSEFIFIGLITFVETKYRKKFDWENIKDKNIDFNFEINGMQILFDDLIEYLVSVFSRTKDERDKYIKRAAIKLLSNKFKNLYNLADRVEEAVRTELDYWEYDR